MTAKAGKYHPECAAVMQSTGAAAVILMVVHGPHGHGLEIMIRDRRLALDMPAVLRNLADEIEQKELTAGVIGPSVGDGPKGAPGAGN